MVTFSCFFFLVGQTNEAAAVGLLQEPVEPPGVDYYLTELERRGCLYQEGPAREPRHDILPKPQRPVRLTEYTVVNLVL